MKNKSALTELLIARDTILYEIKNKKKILSFYFTFKTLWTMSVIFCFLICIYGNQCDTLGNIISFFFRHAQKLVCLIIISDNEVICLNSNGRVTAVFMICLQGASAGVRFFTGWTEWLLIWIHRSLLRWPNTRLETVTATLIHTQVYAIKHCLFCWTKLESNPNLWVSLWNLNRLSENYGTTILCLNVCLSRSYSSGFRSHVWS